MNGKPNDAHLDKEWVELMKMAKNLGLSKDEVHLFLQKSGASHRKSAVN
ncbi:anti-repressor SinI family protein [Salibacterium aidingense]|nr:anti-repressor SinI family protein [Salibacterium aidingense]